MSFESLPKPAPLAVVRSKRRRSVEALRRKVYRLVDVRDGLKCRACGRSCVITLDALPNRWERHHVRFRSLGGEDTSANIIGLCCLCHSEAQQHRLQIVGDADEALEFTNTRTGRVWHS